MTVGLALTSFFLGLRHGVDWDHVAAIADLNGAAPDRRRGFMLSLWYAVGHAAVVLILGAIVIFGGATIPASFDQWMGRIVGATLILLGVFVLVDLCRNGGHVRLRSRWMVVLDGTFAGLRRVRAHRGRRQITVEHTHDHTHGDVTDHAAEPAHDHAHESAAHQQPMSLHAFAGRGVGHDPGRRHRHRHTHHLELPTQPGRGIAAGVGMLHGVGIESPTQIAIFVASTSVVSRGEGFALLLAWIGGLVLANAALALAIGSGLLRPGTNTAIFRAIAAVVAVASIAMGLWYLGA